MTLGYYYGLSWTNVGQHSYRCSSGYLSCLPRMLLRCHKPLGSTLRNGLTNPCGGVGIRGACHPQRRSFRAVIPSSDRMVSWCHTPTGHLGHPLPPNVYFRSWRFVRVLFSTGLNHLSQCVRHHAEGCMALGWIIASVMIDSPRAPDRTFTGNC
jgi:hypothetical protein